MVAILRCYRSKATMLRLEPEELFPSRGLWA
jgi:hypothetical protein